RRVGRPRSSDDWLLHFSSSRAWSRVARTRLRGGCPARTPGGGYYVRTREALPGLLPRLLAVRAPSRSHSGEPTGAGNQVGRAVGVGAQRTGANVPAAVEVAGRSTGELQCWCAAGWS